MFAIIIPIISMFEKEELKFLNKSLHLCRVYPK